jgi:hypothetical protein
MYWPGTERTSWAFWPFGDHIGYNGVERTTRWSGTNATGQWVHDGAGGGSTTVAPDMPVLTAPGWHTLRMELDTQTGAATWYVDGVAQRSAVLPPRAWAGTSTVLSAWGVAFRIAPKVCWANLVVEEANGGAHRA